MARGFFPSSGGSSSSSDENNGSSSRFINRFSLPRRVLREEVDVGGDILFHDYLTQQSELENTFNINDVLFGSGDCADSGLELNGNLLRERTTPLASNQLQNPLPNGNNLYWKRMGSSLREMADAFARSKEGQEVRQKAETVSLNDIDQVGFTNLLVELFTNGITMERVIALFYFCTTLIIRSVTQNRLGITRNLFTWSLGYIRGRICQWVFDHGGWEQVLLSAYPTLVKFGVIAFLAVGIVSGLVFIWKNV